MDIALFEEQYRTQLIELWQKCGLVVLQNDPNKDIDRKLRMNDGLFLIGTIDNQVIASLMAGYDGHRGWFNYLAVEPEFQGQGFARKMVQKAEQQLLKKGCPKINLQIRETNTDVIKIYEALGYRSDPVVSMGKRLIADN